MKADACADSLSDKDVRKFWRNVHKVSNDKATNLANSVAGCTGLDDVIEMWNNILRHYINSQLTVILALFLRPKYLVNCLRLMLQYFVLVM